MSMFFLSSSKEDRRKPMSDRELDELRQFLRERDNRMDWDKLNPGFKL